MQVVVTRARDDAAATGARLVAQGFAPLLLPVLEIVSERLDLAGPVQFVIATSRHAFAALASLPPGDRAVLLARPIHVVGPATALAARAAGFAQVYVAQGDATSMLDLMASTGARGPALYLAGRDRGATLEAGLERLGVETRAHIAYAARARDWTAAERRAAEEAMEAGAAVLHYSRRSAALFLAQIDAAGLDRRLAAFRHLAISENAAQPIRARGLRVVWPASPNEDDLFALLSS